ncbi:CA10 isoform 7 [Pan troglodytes]|uniref:Carbonic anhydrase 10 n=2 Tax=Homininae TaxID=207598 RepID=I3NI54_HUMAN|nr:CA10 isoform 7 [Pan troglodytes]
MEIVWEVLFLLQANFIVCISGDLRRAVRRLWWQSGLEMQVTC